MTKHYDYIAIGGGSGGIASLNRAANYGKKCAIIEAKYLGGTCVNVGCVPKKVMFYGAHIAEAINNYAPDYGFDVEVNCCGLCKGGVWLWVFECFIWESHKCNIDDIRFYLFIMF